MSNCTSEEQKILDENGLTYHDFELRSTERRNKLNEVVQKLNQIENRSRKWENRTVLARFAKFKKQKHYRTASLTQPAASPSNSLTQPAASPSNSLTQPVASSSKSSGTIFDDQFNQSYFPNQGIPNNSSSDTSLEDNLSLSTIEEFDFNGTFRPNNIDFNDSFHPYDY